MVEKINAIQLCIQIWVSNITGVSQKYHIIAILKINVMYSSTIYSKKINKIDINKTRSILSVFEHVIL